MRKLNDADIKTKGFSSTDEIGQCFVYSGEFYRGIYPDKVDSVNEMFASGLVKDLVREGFIPECEITDYYTQTFPLIIKHKMVKTITYNYEWTYDMIKDAGLLVLRLSLFLDKYGYKLKDCHAYNILFEDNKPLYVDFGSIVKKDGRIFNSEEFYRNYIMPIQAMSFYGPMGRLIERAKCDAGFPDKLAFAVGYRSSRLYYVWRRKLHRLIFNLVDEYSFFRKFYYKYCGYYLRNSNYASYTQWSDYQEKVNFLTLNRLEELPSDFGRYKRVIDSLKKLNIRTILEFGGNSGGFAILATRFLNIERYICTDYDEKAVNDLYVRIKSSAGKNPFLNRIMPVVCDFTEIHKGYQYPDMEQRFKSDVVVAMALTHHLVLTQGMDIDSIFERMSTCTNKYLFIEFMPLGLWDGKVSSPIPKWYTLEWFKKHMENYFIVREVKKIEENRVLLIGEKNSRVINGTKIF